MNHYFRKLFTGKILFFLLFCLSVSFYCIANYAQNADSNSHIRINGKDISVEIADTAEKKMTGLMYRESIEDDHGMLFKFDNPEKVYFWMKNVKIPLDILFIYKDKIVKIYKDVPICKSDPCKVYPSEFQIDNALELKGGYCHKNRIKVGQNIELETITTN